MAENVAMKHLLKIVPRENNPGLPTLTQGTKVLTPGGEEIHGVTKISLICEVDDIWRAVIHCNVQPPEVAAEGEIIGYVPKSFSYETSLEDTAARMRGPTRIVKCDLIDPVDAIYKKPKGMFRAFDQATEGLVEIPYTSMNDEQFRLDTFAVGFVFAEVWSP